MCHNGGPHFLSQVDSGQNSAKEYFGKVQLPLLIFIARLLIGLYLN